MDQLEVFLAKGTNTKVSYHNDNRIMLIFAETTLFVDRLFKALESESYLTGQGSRTPSPEATPPSSDSQVVKPPLSKPGPPATVANKSQTAVPRSGVARDGSQSSSSLSGSERGGGGGGERGRVGGGGQRHTEDLRSLEVCTYITEFRSNFFLCVCIFQPKLSDRDYV